MANNELKSKKDTFVDMLSSVNVDIDESKAKTARRNLLRFGAVSTNLNDAVAVAVERANVAMNASEANIKTACYIAGALRASKVWETQKDDTGKPFKSENAFLKGCFPGYQTSTVTLYADVGATIYLPIANGELPGLEDLADMGPSNAKFLLNAVKNADKRAALPDALKQAKEANGGKLTQKAITSAVKTINGKAEASAKPENVTNSAADIADQLSGGSVSMQLAKMISFVRIGDDVSGDLSALVKEGDLKDFMSLLLKARDDKDTALAVCGTLYTLAKKAK